MGWQDNCFFHGTPDTYMTRPGTAPERRLLWSTMESARGEKNPNPDIALAPILLLDKDDEYSNDLDEMVRRGCTSPSEEDMFVVPPISPHIEVLPHLLRFVLRRRQRRPENGVGSTIIDDSWTADAIFEQQRQTTSARLGDYVSGLFDRTLPTPGTSRVGGRTISRELLRLNDRLDATVATEFLPTLRWMATLEQSRDAEHHHHQQQQSSMDPATSTTTRTTITRSSTRLQTQSARKHYFDTLSRTAGWQPEARSTEELAHLMAQDLLLYIRAV